MKPTCQSGVDLLMDYLEGVLAPDVCAAVEEHVAGCPRCLAFVESYRQTPAILRRATAAAMPPDLSRKLSDAIRAEMQKDREAPPTNSPGGDDDRGA
jgi:anti-sigma factor RsiW